MDLKFEVLVSFLAALVIISQNSNCKWYLRIPEISKIFYSLQSGVLIELEGKNPHLNIQWNTVELAKVQS